MAYTSGIFYIDLVSGSDTARTALTSCTASNPSGTVTRINKTAHGLVTGAVVDLTLFSAWLNDAWKITVVDANNFDLDGAVWQTTADNSGTVTPRGGSSWSDAWLTFSSGASSARIQPGDTMRVAKTADPVSTAVNATFTSGSKTVTLASALTKTIEHGVSGWTASANITGSTNTARKYGATATVMTPSAPFTTGKVCYKAIDGGGTQDFSGYTKISFWFRPTSSTIISASTYKLCLCSDATGDVIVNEMNIPATIASSSFHLFVLDYGGALSASVQSVAIYANSDPGTTAFSFSNIVACNSVTHETLIGWQDDCFYSVQAFDGTTVTIDSVSTNTGGRGWYGTNGTSTLYYRNTIGVYNSGNYQSMSETGEPNAKISFIGGWNTSSGLRDGYTSISSNINANGNGINNSLVSNDVSYFIISRFSVGIASSAYNQTTSNCIIACGSTPFSFGSGNRNQTIENCKLLCNTSAFSTISGTYVRATDFFSTGAAGVQLNPSHFSNCRFANNTVASASASSLGVSANRGLDSHTFFYDCLMADATEVATTQMYGVVWSKNHDQTAGNHWGFTNSATINMQSTTVHDTEPVAWRVVHSGSSRSVNYPVAFKVGEFAVSASSLVTFTAWVKKDHATNVGCGIFVENEEYTISGVVADDATAADNTDWQQLTITFTPTVSGVVPIYFRSWYIAGNSNTYIGSISCTQ